MSKVIEQLLKQQQIWQAKSPPLRLSFSANNIATGFKPLDSQLHHGGWPRSAMIDLLYDQFGIGEWQLALPALLKLSQQAKLLVVIAPPYMPYAPAIEQAGLSSEQVLWVQAQTLAESLWASEHILKTNCSFAVMVFLQKQRLSQAQLRRLQLASSVHEGLFFVQRSGLFTSQSSPARLRLKLHAKQRKLHIHILKQPGGWSGQKVIINRPEDWLSPTSTLVTQTHAKPASPSVAPNTAPKAEPPLLL